MVCLPLLANSKEKYAVTIGVETYDTGTFENLKFAKEDATRLGNTFKELGYKTTVMTSDAASAKLKPFDADNIWDVVRSRARICGPEDTFVISLSGHGVQFENEALLKSGVKETYFCPESAGLEDKSTLVPISELLKVVESSKAERKLVLIDACRNEVASKTARKKSAGARIVLESVHESRKSVPRGMLVFFSCSSEQFSWESEKLKSSVFSHFVDQYLKGNAKESYYENGKFTTNGLNLFVSKSTDAFVVNNNFTNDGQIPVLRGRSASWPIAMHSAKASYENTSSDLLRMHAKLGFAAAQQNSSATCDPSIKMPPTQMQFFRLLRNSTASKWQPLK